MKTLKPSEIASYCDVHQRTVSRWIAKGELKGHKLPGRGNYRVQLPDFLQFLTKYQMPMPVALEDIAPAKILLIDDEAAYLKALSRVFSRQGYQISSAQDGFAAGVSLMSNIPDLLTLDINMPGLNGYEVLQYIRDTDVLKHIKVIVISGLGEAELEKAMQLGADAYLSKPFDNKQLLDLAEQLLDHKD